MSARLLLPPNDMASVTASVCVCVCMSVLVSLCKLYVPVFFTHTHTHKCTDHSNGKTITYFFTTQPLWFQLFGVFRLFASKTHMVPTAITIMSLQEQLMSYISIISYWLSFFLLRRNLKLGK